MDDTHKSQKCTCITAGLLVWKTGTGFVVVKGYEPNPTPFLGSWKDRNQCLWMTEWKAILFGRRKFKMNAGYRRQGLLHYLWMEAGMKDLTMPELEDPFSFINRQQNLLGRDVEV